MQSKKNPYIREPLTPSYLRTIEKKYRKELYPMLATQIDRITTRQFMTEVMDVVKKYSIKRLDERVLSQVIAELDILLTKVEQLQNNSSASRKLSATIYEMMLETGRVGLDNDKQKLLVTIDALGQKFHDERVKDIIAGLKKDTRPIETIAGYEQLVREFVNDSIVSMNNTQRQHIRKYLVRQIQSGKTEEEMWQGTSELLRINEARAWSVARTSIIKSKNVQAGEYYRSVGIQNIRWVCNDPEDHLCLMNCGAVRQIGQPFPSMVTEPPVHTNCQCGVEMVTIQTQIEYDQLIGVLQNTISFNFDLTGTAQFPRIRSYTENQNINYEIMAI